MRGRPSYESSDKVVGVVLPFVVKLCVCVCGVSACVSVRIGTHCNK